MQKMHILVSIGLLTHTGPTVNVGWAPAAARMRAPRPGLPLTIGFAMPALRVRFAVPLAIPWV